MKPRARRVTVAAVVLGAGVLAILVVTHWGTVRDHIEAWHFRLTKETRTIEPNPTLANTFPEDTDILHTDLSLCLSLLSTYSSLRVIAEPEPVRNPKLFVVTSSEAEDPDDFELTAATADAARHALQDKGFRVLEQHFPRRAWVIIPDAEVRAVLESVRHFGLRP